MSGPRPQDGRDDTSKGNQERERKQGRRGRKDKDKRNKKPVPEVNPPLAGGSSQILVTSFETNSVPSFLLKGRLARVTGSKSSRGPHPEYVGLECGHLLSPVCSGPELRHDTGDGVLTRDGEGRWTCTARGPYRGLSRGSDERVVGPPQPPTRRRDRTPSRKHRGDSKPNTRYPTSGLAVFISSCDH